MDDLKLPLNQAAAMSHLLRLVSSGYYNYFSGRVHLELLETVVAKLRHRWPMINANANARAYRKKTGRFNADLVITFDHQLWAKDQKLLLYLLATPGKPDKGEADIVQVENLHNALAEPLYWPGKYELVKARKQCKVKGKSTTHAERWTWRMQHRYKLELDALLSDKANANPAHFLTALENVRHIPMFSGIRDQVTKLNISLSETWRKQHQDRLYPDILANLPMMPKIKVFGDLTLPVLIKRLKAEIEEKEGKAMAEAEDLVT